MSPGADGASRRPCFKALRRQPTQRRGMQRVTDVLDAAERLLRRRHFDAVSIEDIAAAAHIQIGSLYHFFENKTSILLAVLERALQAEADAFRPVPQDAERTLQSYLRALEARLQAHWRPRTSLLTIYYAYQRHPLLWASVLELRAQVARDIAAKIRQLYPQLPRATATAVGEQIGIVIAVLHDNIISVGPKAARRLTRESLDMLSAYVRSKAEGSRSNRAR